MNWCITLVVLASLVLGSTVLAADPADKGLLKDESFFPIAVWLQSPANAAKYKEAGINLYVALWEGPTEEQLAALKKAGMPVICDQNDVGLKHLDDKTIVGWMHGDEPDNAQPITENGKKGWGPPIPPKTIIEDYRKIKKNDPSRPVMLNLGQGVAWDQWIGRGVRTNHPEDYPQYIKGGDIISFDIYPVAHDNKDVKGNLWYVPKGVQRLVEWTKAEKEPKSVWSCIECTHISAPTKATPQQVKSEVWMAIIHGAKGLIYFVHEFKPKFNEHALLDDPDMLKGVTAINAQIKELAPVLNADTVKATAATEQNPVATMIKKHGGATYLFAVGMREGTRTATFQIPGVPAGTKAEVIGEGREIIIKSEGEFADEFKDYAVHLYRIR